MENNNRKRRLAVSVLVLVLLIGMCVLTAYAASLITREVKDNYFQTGVIDIELQADKIDLNNIEPGGTYVRNFSIVNKGTWEVYYKVYFSDIKGALKDVLEVTIYPKDHPGEVLFSGSLGDMTQRQVQLADDTLDVGEIKELTVSFHFPEERGNDTQERSCEFKICATAVQTKNNPNREGF